MKEPRKAGDDKIEKLCEEFKKLGLKQRRRRRRKVPPLHVTSPGIPSLMRLKTKPTLSLAIKLGKLQRKVYQPTKTTAPSANPCTTRQ